MVSFEHSWAFRVFERVWECGGDVGGSVSRVTEASKVADVLGCRTREDGLKKTTRVRRSKLREMHAQVGWWRQYERFGLVALSERLLPRL